MAIAMIATVNDSRASIPVTVKPDDMVAEVARVAVLLARKEGKKVEVTCDYGQGFQVFTATPESSYEELVHFHESQWPPTFDTRYVLKLRTAVAA
jgi:hypothetical protein